MLEGDNAVRLASLLVVVMGAMGKIGSDAQRLSSLESQAVVDERCVECPSYCDETGARHDPVNCRLAAALTFCCNFGARLDCCSNETLMITSDIGDEFHCSALGAFNRTVLSVCVPVGFVCFVMAVVLIIFQKVRKSRRRQRRSSNNSHFDRRSSSNASCSSRSSRSSIGSHHLPRPRQDSVSHSNNNNDRQQQQQQQQAAVVLSPSNLEDTIRINDDVVLRVLQPVNAFPSGAASAPVTSATSAETCFVIQSTVYPPPYTNDRPPPYSDIFPS